MYHCNPSVYSTGTLIAFFVREDMEYVPDRFLHRCTLLGFNSVADEITYPIKLFL